MSTRSLGSNRLILSPPDKGSFPLDHEGICKNLMCKYMQCLKENNRETSRCREEIKNYLDCRMKNELMAQEPLRKLGLSEFETSE